MSHEISRRQAIKFITGSGVALYLTPHLNAWAQTVPGMAGAATASAFNLSNFSPIDRSLPQVATKDFFADDPERAHKILWDKATYLKSISGKIPANPEKAPLVVIGGGMSGLVSAYLLREYQPIVLEMAPRFGGNAKGQSWQGIDYSIGAAYFIEPEAETDIANLITELGIDQIWKIKSEEDPVAINGSIYKAFWSGETLGDDAPAKEQLEKLATYFKTVNEGETIPYPDIPITDPEQESYIKELDKVSFKSHLEKVAGGRLHPHIETAIEQYCWSSLNASASEVSAAAGLNFYASEFSNIALLPGGNAAVAERVLERLSQAVPAANLRANSLVFDVTVKSDGVHITYVNGADQVQTIVAQAAIMACPKFVAAKVLNEIEAERLKEIQKIKYRSYLVANVCLQAEYGQDPFYDLYMLGDGKLDTSNTMAAAQGRKVTDVILANYAKSVAGHTVLTLYRGMPYEGARADLYAPGSYGRYRDSFERQINETILPLLKLKKESVVDLRIARWGHPLPVAATGMIANGTTASLRKPFRGKVFFVEQDNWVLPAFETALTEALLWAPEVKKVLPKAKQA